MNKSAVVYECNLKGGEEVFGIPDLTILAAYLLCILSALICLVYGLYNWNRGGETEAAQMNEEAEWEKNER